MSNASTGRKTPSAVAIGCSAGGLVALKKILPLLPADFPAAIFITLHRSEASVFSVAEVLSKHANAELVDAEDKTPVVDGRIYIAPYGYHMLVERSHSIALSTDPPVCYCRPAIDPMFQTAAWAYRDRLAAVILSGANEDGSEGMREVKKEGGLCIVQSPSSAEFGIMPRKVLEAVAVDHVLDLDAIPPRLIEFACGS